MTAAGVVLALLAANAWAQPAVSPAPEPAASPAGFELGPDPRLVLGAPRGHRLEGTALDASTEETASLLRCPVCQGLSIADSPSGMALNMKGQVRDLLASGYDREQVIAYFERSYGEFVRLQPPLRGVNWLLWTAPLASLLAGGWVVSRMLRSRAAGPAGAQPDAPPAADPTLARYVDQVRALVEGGPAPPDKTGPSSTR